MPKYHNSVNFQHLFIIQLVSLLPAPLPSLPNSIRSQPDTLRGAWNILCERADTTSEVENQFSELGDATSDHKNTFRSLHDDVFVVASGVFMRKK